MTDEQLRDWLRANLRVRVDAGWSHRRAWGEQYLVTVELMLTGSDEPIAADYATIDNLPKD